MNDRTRTRTRRVTVRCQFCLKPNRVDLARASQRPKCGECGKPMLLDRPVRVTDEDLGRLVRDAEVPVMVDFHADWCGPCKMMAPLLDDFAREHQGEVLVAKLDTDRNPDSARQYGVRGIPTLILFDGGLEVARQTGAVPRADLERMISGSSG